MYEHLKYSVKIAYELFEMKYIMLLEYISQYYEIMLSYSSFSKNHRVIIN